MDEQRQSDAAAAGAAALAGVVAICRRLAAKDIFDRDDIVEIGEVMLAAIDRAEATPPRRADLRQELSSQFVALLEKLP